MKRTLVIALAVAGISAARAPVADAAGSFSATSSQSGGSSASHGGGRSGHSSSARSAAGSRAATHSSVARGSAQGYRFTPASQRGGDPYRYFSPGSVLPISRGGFVAGGFNGACFAGHPAWNGRRFCFPFRFGSRAFGNGFAYLGSDYLDSDYEAKPSTHRETAYQDPDDPVLLPIAASANVSPPTPGNASPGVVSREFAYGSIVTDVQSRLAGAGYFRGSIDGYITAGTRTAIATFQDSRQLVITGRIDAALLQALGLKP